MLPAPHYKKTILIFAFSFLQSVCFFISPSAAFAQVLSCNSLFTSENLFFELSQLAHDTNLNLNPTSNKEKWALLSTLINYFGYNKGIFAPPISGKLGAEPKTLDFTYNGVLETLQKLNSIHVRPTSFRKRISPDAESEARERISETLLRVKVVPDLINALRSLNLTSDSRLSSLLQSGTQSNWRERLYFANNAAVNAMTTAIWGLPLLYPGHPLSRLKKVPEHLLNQALEENWQDFYSKNKLDLEKLGVADKIWRIGKKTYVAAVGILVLNLSVSTLPWVNTIFNLLKQNTKAVATYEQAHYNSQQIVQEQFQSWLASLDYVPSPQDQATQLKLIEDLERSGTFRIYSSE